MHWALYYALEQDKMDGVIKLLNYAPTQYFDLLLNNHFLS